MIRKLALAVGLFAFVAGGIAARYAIAAPSKCDAGVTKAEGKKASCKAGVVAKGQAKGTAPDAAKLAKCNDKFTKACTKARSAGDCMAQAGQTCAQNEAEVDNCVVQFSSSPSAAFLN